MHNKKHIYLVAVLAISVAGCGGKAAQKSEIKPQSVQQSQMQQPQVQPEAVAIEAVVEEGVEVTPVAEESVTIVDVIKTERIAGPVVQEAAASKDRAPAQIPPAIKTDPNHFMLTLVVKDTIHPFHGIGDKEGFAIDGVQGGEIILRRGQTYTFEIHSSPRHDAYLSSDNIGWGAGVLEQGVEGNFVHDGVIAFKPGLETPEVVYYQCQNHKAMGGRIFIVNENDKSNLADLRLKHGVLGAAAGHQKDKMFVTKEEVKQKISYANIVAMSAPAKRVAASNNKDARDMLAESNKLLSDASAILAANDGREVQAMILVDDALRKMSEASRMVPSEQVLQEWRDRYNELNKHVKEQRATHKKQYDSVVAEKGAKAAVAYDSKEVESILTEAQTLYQKENFQDAIKRVEEADMLVTAALNEMMKSQTVMYKLNLDTPEGEYKYEYDAYLGYVELVPVALEEKQPSDEQRKLFDNFVSKAEDMHKRAGELAKQGNYPDAISVIRAATTQMRNGLRLLGVQQ